MKYLPPEALGRSFTCPHCGSIAQQRWWTRKWDGDRHSSDTYNMIRVSVCTHCDEHTLWVGELMVFPATGTAPWPNPEMPEPVRKLYSEAASIHSKSPRGAAALLRLALQVLCCQLGEKGKNINEDIKSLVAKGLPSIVQQSLDLVRVTGNEAVHPGQIDTDDPEVVASLFELVNVIVEYMIALPNKVSGLYTNLPANALSGIENRDKS